MSRNELEAIKTELIELLKEENPTASFSQLRADIETNTALARECHPILHHLGHEAYKKYGSFSKTISYQDGLCNSGYTHGVIEAHFLAAKNVQQTLLTTCDESARHDFTSWQCFHGTGHGVMYVTNKNLGQSLELCQKHATDFARKSCVNGVFMERFIVISHSGQHAANSNSVGIELCPQQPDKYKGDCYTYAPTAYLSHNPNQYEGAISQCNKAESDYITTCVYGVGSQAMKDNVTKPEISLEVCSKAPKAYEDSCVYGAIGLLINHHASVQVVAPMCETIFSGFKNVCEQAIETKTKLFAS